MNKDQSNVSVVYRRCNMKRKILAVGCVILLVIAGYLIWVLTPHMKLGEPNSYQIEELPGIKFYISEKTNSRWPVKFDYVIENNNEHDFKCNNYGEIQYKKDNTWYTLETKKEIPELDGYNSAKPGETIMDAYNCADFYNRLPKGEYLFLKPVFLIGLNGRHWISAEFIVD